MQLFYATMGYINEGYVTSGAVIESVLDGVVKNQIFEGVFESVNIKTDGRLKECYIRDRLRTAEIKVVNQKKIAEVLQDL